MLQPFTPRRKRTDVTPVAFALCTFTDGSHAALTAAQFCALPAGCIESVVLVGVQS